jgi:hypothetical protein
MNIIILLDQKEIWVDRQGVSHKVAEMDPRYAGNVVRFLERQAEGIADRYCFAMLSVPLPDGGTEAYDIVTSDFERTMDEVLDDSRSWLQRTPLVRALTERAKAVA